MKRRPHRHRSYHPDFIAKVLKSKRPHRFVGPDLPESTLRGWLKRFKKMSEFPDKSEKYSPYLIEIARCEDQIKQQEVSLAAARRLIDSLSRIAEFSRVKVLFSKPDVRADIVDAFEEKAARKTILKRLRHELDLKAPVRRAVKKRGLTAREIRIMKRYLTASRYKKFGIRTLARLAQRNGHLHCAEQTWHRYRNLMGLKRQIQIPRPKYPSRPGIRATKVNEIWHVDVSTWRMTGQRELVWIAFVVDNFSRAILSHSVREQRSGDAIVEVLVQAINFAKRGLDLKGLTHVTIFSDHGSENRCRVVQEFIAGQQGWKSVFAQRDTGHSNACVEGVFRLLKQRTLRRRNQATIRALRQSVSRFVDEYNEKIPHNALKGALPVEVYRGETPEIHLQRAKEMRRVAQSARSRACA